MSWNASTIANRLDRIEKLLSANRLLVYPIALPPMEYNGFTKLTYTLDDRTIEWPAELGCWNYMLPVCIKIPGLPDQHRPINHTWMWFDTFGYWRIDSLPLDRYEETVRCLVDAILEQIERYRADAITEAMGLANRVKQYDSELGRLYAVYRMGQLHLSEFDIDEWSLIGHLHHQGLKASDVKPILRYSKRYLPVFRTILYGALTRLTRWMETNISENYGWSQIDRVTVLEGKNYILSFPDISIHNHYGGAETYVSIAVIQYHTDGQTRSVYRSVKIPLLCIEHQHDGCQLVPVKIRPVRLVQSEIGLDMLALVSHYDPKEVLRIHEWVDNLWEVL